ncbi:hypothetical protein MD484_g4581, partial [Candolleomyces efflorescens]
MFSVGALIWISLRPLLQLAIGVACGFVITRLDMFPPIAARGASQIILNVTMPCLMFSKIVPAFNADNIRVFGPLLLVAGTYQLLGIVLAWIIKQFFWVPHRFRHGLLVAGGWGNIGDIPISVILSVTGTAPFSGTQDQNLSIAYLSVFLLVFIFTLFPLGGHRWVAMDYVGPDVEPLDVQNAIRRRRRKMFCLPDNTLEAEDVERDPQQREKPPEMEQSRGASSSAEEVEPAYTLDSIQKLRRLNTIHDDSTTITPISEQAEETVISAPTEVASVTRIKKEARVNIEAALTDNKDKEDDKTSHEAISFQSATLTRKQIFLQRLKSFLSSLLSAPSISIIVSFPIAIVPQLTALFTYVPESKIPSAPDGHPPLAFIMDTAAFMGAASVPLGLVCLGSALARLKIPNQWKSLPVGAISSLAIAKLLIMPVFGVLIVRGLVHGGIISADDKVFQFVCIFCSCLPTATTQVYLTQVYNVAGEAEHLSAFLIPQYIIMFFSMTALTAFTLHLIF